MAEYIEREALLEKLKERDLCLCVSEQDIKDAPAADVAPVVRGRWKAIGADKHGRGTEYVCSSCSKCYPYVCNYCPNCGAKMQGELNE